MLQISQPTYSRYETATLDIPSFVLIKLSNFHNVSVDYTIHWGKRISPNDADIQTKRQLFS
nr:helix-turn-helix transcriptional regulator [Paenibacillus xylanexedens]